MIKLFFAIAIAFPFIATAQQPEQVQGITSGASATQTTEAKCDVPKKIELRLHNNSLGGTADMDVSDIAGDGALVAKGTVYSKIRGGGPCPLSNAPMRGTCKNGTIELTPVDPLICDWTFVLKKNGDKWVGTYPPGTISER